MRNYSLAIAILCALFATSLVRAQESESIDVDDLMVRVRELKDANDYEAALDRAKSALNRHRRTKNPDQRQTAHILKEAAYLSNQLNQNAQAQAYAEESLKILESLGENRGITAVSCHLVLGNVADDLGDYSVKMFHFGKAVDISRKLGDKELLSKALKLSASGFRDIGKYEEAYKADFEALTYLQKLFGETSVEVATANINAAQDLEGLNYYDEASKSVDIALKILGKERPDSIELADAYQMRGLLDSRTEKFEKAIQNFEKSLKIQAAVISADSPRSAYTLIHQAHAYRLIGEFDKALNSFRKAERRLVRAHGANSPSVAVCQYGIAEVSFLKQDMAGALKACDQARRITKENFVNVLPYLSEREQLGFIGNEDTQRFFEVLSAAQLYAGDDQVAALSAGWTINSKGLAQESLIQQNRLLSQMANSNRKADVDKLLSLRQQIAQIELSATQEGVAKVRDEVDPLKLQADELTRSLLGDAASKRVRSSWVELEDVRRALDAGTYIIQYAKFRQFKFDTQYNWGNDHYVAWVIPPAGQDKVRLIDLGPAEPIDKLITEVRQDISAASKPDGAIKKLGEEAATKQLSQKLAKLRTKILEPLATHVRKAQSLILSPDSSLWLAPWQALPADDSSKFLIEQFTLSFVISPSQVLYPKEVQGALQAPVIFANPKFDLTPNDVWQSIRDVLRTKSPSDAERTRSVQGFSNRSFLNVAPLPGTATEAALITPTLEQLTGKKPQQYLDRFALETIARSINRPRVLVFGTHGFFLNNDVDGKKETSASSLEDGLNPLSRCGLLLAGCKATGAGKDTAGDDGVLTGMEIASLNLNSTELVILSACETAVGTPRVGEGVASLCQAFQLAGARSVVASLWSVSDRESALLINKFVEELASGKSKPEAMRSAQLDRIERRRQRFGAAHPFFWSAFTVNGN